MVEKQVEALLNDQLKTFDKSCIYYTPEQHEILKAIFQNASKTGNGRGIPDRLYFDNKTLIIFECKYLDINMAIKDLKIYAQKISVPNIYSIYYVAFTLNIYKIFDETFKEIDGLLLPTTFNLNNAIKINKTGMNSAIRALHNYIRDYTKISNEDKSYFIACVLLALKKESFRNLISNYKSTKYIYDLIADAIKTFDIDITVFKFFQNDKNNAHFYNIVNMVKKIYDNSPSIDLLNQFYSEFVKYSNTDSKSLGIVLTPPHIVEIMVKMLNISQNDIFLDLCAGTGSFIIEAMKYRPLYAFGIEYQTKLYALMKINMILREYDNIQLYKDDCFNIDFASFYDNNNITKSAINPPYGTKDKKELEFVIKQLKCLKIGGFATAIFPVGKLNNNASNNILKKQIMQLGKIHTIILCNPKLFYPVANVGVCIVLIERCDNAPTSYEINLIDYRDDGLEISTNRGLIRTDKFEQKYNSLIEALTNNKEYLLKLDSDWCFLDKRPSPELSINMTELKLSHLQLEFQRKLKATLTEPIEIKNINTKLKTFKIKELFYILKKPREKFNGTKTVNICAAVKNNNGIKTIGPATINTFTGNKILLVCGGDGGAGLAFYQADPFNITSSTAVLAPKNIILTPATGLFIAQQLSNYKAKYSYAYQWSITRIKEDIIQLPVMDNNEINYKLIEEIVNNII